MRYAFRRRSVFHDIWYATVLEVRKSLDASSGSEELKNFDQSCQISRCMSLWCLSVCSFSSAKILANFFVCSRKHVPCGCAHIKNALRDLFVAVQQAVLVIHLIWFHWFGKLRPIVRADCVYNFTLHEPCLCSVFLLVCNILANFFVLHVAVLASRTRFMASRCGAVSITLSSCCLSSRRRAYYICRCLSVEFSEASTSSDLLLWWVNARSGLFFLLVSLIVFSRPAILHNFFVCSRELQSNKHRFSRYRCCDDGTSHFFFDNYAN